MKADIERRLARLEDRYSTNRPNVYMFVCRPGEDAEAAFAAKYPGVTRKPNDIVFQIIPTRALTDEDPDDTLPGVKSDASHDM